MKTERNQSNARQDYVNKFLWGKKLHLFSFPISISTLYQGFYLTVDLSRLFRNNTRTEHKYKLHIVSENQNCKEGTDKKNRPFAHFIFAIAIC